MAQFIRIKSYVINLDTLTYIRIEDDWIDFGFTFPTEKPGGQNFVRLVRASTAGPRIQRGQGVCPPARRPGQGSSRIRALGMACMNDRGFVRAVVMEGMIAVAILGIIAAIVVPAIVNYKDRPFHEEARAHAYRAYEAAQTFFRANPNARADLEMISGTATGLLPMYV